MNKIEALRTPDSQFENLPGYAFTPNYAMVPGELRMHYLDENPENENTIVLLHGEPSWSYLYRKMIPVLSNAGFRVIAPDLIGFGKSDKPVHTSDYSFQRHMDWMKSLLFDHLNLSNINLFVQDWGGLIGLRLLGEHPDRFEKIVAANTGLPTGDQPMGPAFEKWKQQSQMLNPFPVGQIIQMGTTTKLDGPILQAYDAPFPDENYKAGAKIFPVLVPSTPDDPASEANRRAWKGLMKFEGPFLTLFSDMDPITSGGEKVLQKLIPGSASQNHQTIQNAGHFLQEDKGEEIAEKMIAFLKS